MILAIIVVLVLFRLMVTVMEIGYEKSIRGTWRLLALSLLLLLGGVAFGQNVRWDAQSTTTTGTGQLLPVLAIPGSYINFYTGCSTLPCASPATTYLSATSGTTCPSSSQVVWQLPIAAGCVATADSQGNFGGYFAAGTYQYTITVSGHVAGPYQFNVGGGGGGSGLLLEHNGVALNQNLLNFLDITPGGPPAGNTNVTIETDGFGDWSGYVPNTTAPVTSLIAGTCISLTPSDGLGNVTITGTCTPSAGITPVQVVLSTTLIAANTCTTQTPVTMTGVTAPSGTTPGSVFAVVPEGNPGAVNGWGATGGLVMQVWATANTLNYNLCNQSGNSITPGALTVDVSAGSGGGGGGGSGTVTGVSTPSGSWPSWLVPTTTNGTTNAVISVTAGLIPTSALTNNTITLGTTNVVLGNTIASAAGFQSATTLALAGTPTQCTTGNAPTGILANGNATGCQSITGGGGGGGTTVVFQVNGANTFNQALQNLTNTSTVLFNNTSGGIITATVPTASFGALGVSSPDNVTISASSGVYRVISPGASTILGFGASNTYAGFTAGTNISFASNQITDTNPANTITSGLTAGVIPVSLGGVTLGPSTLTNLAGSTIIGSGTTACVDGWCILTVSGTTATYTFANSYGVHPVCIGELEGTSPGITHEVSYTGTTAVTFTFSSSVSGNFDFHCDKRT